MIYKGFKHFIDWTWLVIFPTITILKNEPRYLYKNFSIQFHWLGFHLRWFWITDFKDEYESVETYPDKRAELKITKKEKEE